MGFSDIRVEQRGDVVYLSGTVSSESDRQAAVGVARTLASDVAVDATELAVLTGGGPDTIGPDQRRGDALQAELSRIVAGTPIIFETGQTTLTELHIRILNNVAMVLSAYPQVPVTVVGYTDAVGDTESNRRLSLTRAENVRTYLVSQGIAEAALVPKPEGRHLDRITSTG